MTIAPLIAFDRNAGLVDSALVEPSISIVEKADE
jgi:hypothetical protein